MTQDILHHLRDLEENLSDWEQYLQETGEDGFLSDRKSRHALLHSVLVALQAAIDIGNHWISRLTPQRPESYKAIAELLADRKGISQDLRKDLQRLFSLRNVLIHKYQDLDLSRLYRELQDGTQPLRKFLNLARAKMRS